MKMVRRMIRNKVLLLFLVAFALGNVVMGVEVYTLEQCREMARGHNKSLQVSQERVNAARNLKRAAFTQYLPNVQAAGSYTWMSREIQLLSDESQQTLGNMGSLTTSQMNSDLTNAAVKYQTAAATYAAAGNATAAAEAAAAATSIKNSAPALQVMGQSMSGTMNAIGQGIVDAFEMDNRNVWVGSILLTQPIFMGGKIVEANRMAKCQREMAETQLDKQLGDATYETDNAYWRVVSVVNKKRLAESFVKLLAKLDSDVTKSITVGTSTKADGLSVKVKLNEARVALVQCENGIRLSKMALAQQCGLPLDAEFDLADENLEPHLAAVPFDSSSIAEGVDNRQEVKELGLMLKMAESNRRLMIGRFLPHAGLTAGYVVSNPSAFNGFQKDWGGYWNVSVGVYMPLFHFGERIHTLNAARNMRNVAQWTLDEAKEKVTLDITQARQKVIEASTREQMTNANQQSADENLKYAELSYEAGVIAPSILMEAQTAWLKAHSAAIDASIETRMAEAALLKAKGELK